MGNLQTTNDTQFLIARDADFLHVCLLEDKYFNTEYSMKFLSNRYKYPEEFDKTGQILTNKHFELKKKDNGKYEFKIITKNKDAYSAEITKAEAIKFVNHLRHYRKFIVVDRYLEAEREAKKTGVFVKPEN